MKKDGSGAIGYLMLFWILIIAGIMSLFMLQKAKLMTMQHDIDDALADSVLAALVADDVYYFESYEQTGIPVIRYRNVDESYSDYKDCMDAAVSNTTDFYYNLTYDELILYEVAGENVTVTSFIGNDGIRYSEVYTGENVISPDGTAVTKTSAYAKVSFDIKSMLDDSYIRKSRDLYCTFEIN